MKEVCPMCGQSFFNATVTIGEAIPTGEICARPGCNQQVLTDRYCVAGHAQPVKDGRTKRDFPLGGDFDDEHAQ